jgi:hypothetical protein
VAAPGPSLVPVESGPIIAVQDAWRMVPWADVLYGCDPQWWLHHKGTKFAGEKWSTHDWTEGGTNNKKQAHDEWGVRCVLGAPSNTFSLDPSVIHYGNNSGFQAINLAIHFGCTYIVLVGFDMRRINGQAHFFGNHPQGLGNGTQYTPFVKDFAAAAKALPDHIEIVNATPGSALDCFPMVDLEDATKILLDKSAA